MDGITDSPFRQICKSFGASFVTTEMIPCQSIFYKSEKYIKKAYFTEIERPITIQLYASNPEHIKKAVIKLNKFEPDFFELNAGCPSPKVARNGCGAALLKDFSNLKNCCETLCQYSQVPVTLKTRLGWCKYTLYLLADFLNSSDIKVLKIHGRTASQKYKGLALWDNILEIKNLLKIPVIGNGDIKNYTQAKERIENFTPFGVMIGRASRGNPWLFSEKIISKEEKKDIIIKHSCLMEEFYGNWGIIIMRKHLLWYLKSFHKAKSLRFHAVRIETVDDIKKVLSMW